MTRKQKKRIINNLKDRLKRGLAGTLALYMFLTSLMVFAPTWWNDSYALTGGPSQPEVQSFEPIGTSDMVDLFSGDFTYNIPLLDVEGYPINLAYHSGVTMDQEASWVGLGWNVNVGAVNRMLRGLPDDFNGDEIKTETNINKNWTIGIDASIGDIELFGIDPTAATQIDLNLSVGVNYNNYNGVGFSTGVGLDVSTELTESSGLIGGGGLGLNSSSSGGLDISPSLSLSKKIQETSDSETKLSGNFGASFNSRAGLSNLSIGTSMTTSKSRDAQYKRGPYKGKNKKSITSLSGGSASFDLMQSTYTPTITNSMRSFAVTGRVKWAAALWGTDVGIALGVSYSEQKLQDTEKITPAYGYLYSQTGQYNVDARHDFNRENDGSVTPSTPNLALANHTYDIYSVSGQGTGGSYRPFRNQIGYVYDNAATNKSSSTPITVEVGSGGLFHGGTEFGTTVVNSNSGPWTSGSSPFDGNNSVDEVLNFNVNDNASDKELVVFREANEAGVWTDPDYYEIMGEDNAVKIKLQEVSDFNVAALPIINGNSVSDQFITRGYKEGRVKRNVTIQNLTIGEVKNKDLGVGNFMTGSYALAGNDHNHHIGQIVSLGNDGMRYIYGQPAYNITQEEVTFAVGKGLEASSGYSGSRDYAQGLVTYDPGVDNSKNNNHGLDNFFQKVTTPGYAHSYLLTSILSDDYVDVDNVKGPSPGDLGSYTKFIYENPFTHDEPYKWRVPVQANKASYNEGLKGDFTDDKGSYIYGEKEIYYLDKIETKNFVAVFLKSDREDALGVSGENGGLYTQKKMQKLDKIVLYSKPDYEKMQADPNNYTATALKTVHFVYDYELCPNTPNSGASTGGKLTLKKVFFTYRDSQKGKLSPYAFNYDGYNPVYNLKGYDRWGNYKENPSGIGSSGYIALNEDLPTYEYPYSDQDQALADMYTSAWTMTSVDLPSGGTIEMEYESDDYYYVQHKEAMEMAKIIDVGDNELTPENLSFGQVSSVSTSGAENKVIFFEKDPNHDAWEYTVGIENLYFRCLTEFAAPDLTLPQGRYDYVSGYAEIENQGEYSPTIGWIKLKPVSFRDHNPNNTNSEIYNPIAFQGIQFGQLHLPKYVWDSPEFPEEGGIVVDAIGALHQTMVNFVEGFKNPNKALFDRRAGTDIVMGKSWLRLNNVDDKKLGGGCRVAKIQMVDSWDEMAGLTSADYGQVYDYTMSRIVNGQEVVYSSGVASYEPQLGGDENPWKQPIFFGEKKVMAPDPRFYQETPIGESFFPSASIGYSKVTVSNLPRPGVSKNATGKVVHEFYTAKDFPTIAKKTDIDPKQHKNPAFSIASIFKIDAKDYYTGSQGFVVITNDMHGKPRSQSVYQEDQEEPITKVEYFYKQEQGSDPGTKELVNEVSVINKNGTVESRPIGVNFDMVADFRENTTEVKSISANLNVDGLLLGFITLPIPMVWPKMTKEKTMFRSATLTKVVQKFGILETTRATDLGSVVETKNLAYDAETGQVLLTETQTNFDDKVYSMNFPAYWYYDNMGQAYKNIDFRLYNKTLSNGVFTDNNARYFIEGDELYLDLNGSDVKGWVTNVSGNTVTIQDFNGNLLSGNASIIKVIRSGRRNMQSQMMASVTTLTNPLNSIGSNLYEDVLQASAIEFTDEWRTYCDCNGTAAEFSTNPYVLGTRGNYRPKVSYLHLSNRTQSDYNNNTNIREDGVFKSYRPYYKLDNNGAWEIDGKDWTYTAEVTEFNPFGQELANEDALGRESAAQFGFNQTLAKAVAANAGYRDIGFSSFEDDDFSVCADNHFKFEQPQQRTADDAHAGLYSVRVTNGNDVTLKRDLVRCDQTGCNLQLSIIDNGESTISLTASGGSAPYTTHVSVLSGAPVILPSTDGPQVLLQGTFSVEYNVVDADGCRSIEVIEVINGNLSN